MCVYAHTQTHCTYGVLGCDSRGRDETPGGPEESRWTKSRYTYIRICVQSTQVYVYAGTRDEILDYQLVFFNNFFLSTKEKKDVNANH